MGRGGARGPALSEVLPELVLQGFECFLVLVGLDRQAGLLDHDGGVDEGFDGPVDNGLGIRLDVLDAVGRVLVGAEDERRETPAEGRGEGAPSVGAPSVPSLAHCGRKAACTLGLFSTLVAPTRMPARGRSPPLLYLFTFII